MERFYREEKQKGRWITGHCTTGHCISDNIHLAISLGKSSSVRRHMRYAGQTIHCPWLWACTSSVSVSPFRTSNLLISVTVTEKPARCHCHLTHEVWLHESKTTIKATKCFGGFSADSSRCHSNLWSPLQTESQPNWIWDCMELGEVGLVNQSFSHCSAYTAREFTGGSTLPSRGVWNPVCLPHSADPTAPGRGNVFSLLLKKKVPASVCLCAWTQNALTDHLSHFEITIIKALWWVRHVDRESVHHCEEMEEERGLFFVKREKEAFGFPGAWPAFAVEYVRQERNGSAGGLRHLRNHWGATFQGRNLHFVFCWGIKLAVWV